MIQALTQTETESPNTDKPVFEHTVLSQKDIPNKDIDISDNSRETISATVAELASLSPLDYDLKRKDVAKDLGVQVKTLDAEVKTARSDVFEPSSMVFPKITPYSESIPPADLFNEIANTIQSFVVLDDEQALAMALWIAMTWVVDVLKVAPLAIINAPERSAGKSPIPMTTAAVAGSRDGNLTSESFSLRKDSGPYSSDSADKKSGNVINSGAEGVGNLYDTLMPSAQGTSSVAGSYEPKKKRTLFIKHGAGGTAAITDDVQTAIVKAYYDVCNTLSNETSMVRDPTKPAAGSLLKEIVDAVVPPQGATTSLDGLKLHPLTKRVLCNALNELKGGGGQRYQEAIRAEGSTKGNKAILAVKDAYRIMSESLETDAGLPTAADLKGNSVISNHFKSGWF